MCYADGGFRSPVYLLRCAVDGHLDGLAGGEDMDDHQEVSVNHLPQEITEE